MNALVNATSTQSMLETMEQLVSKERNRQPLSNLENLAMVAMIIVGCAETVHKAPDNLKYSTMRGMKDCLLRFAAEVDTPYQQKDLFEKIGSALGAEPSFIDMMRDLHGEGVQAKTAIRIRNSSQTYIVRKMGTTQIKIGRSADFKKRFKTLTTMSGHHLEVLCVIDKDIETELHARFIAYRHVGEWFNDTDGYIASYAKDYTTGVVSA